MFRLKSAAVVVCAAGVAGSIAGSGFADSTPVGPLPAGPSSAITTAKGELVSLALPARGSGRVWRIAQLPDSRILRQVGEGQVGKNVVLVFKSYAPGTTRISVALTAGETSSKALEARRLTVRVK